MSIRQPKFDAKRPADKTLMDITLLNFEAGDIWSVYKGIYLEEFTKVVTDHTTDTVQITDLDEDENYWFLITLNNLPAIKIISDFSSATPVGYYVGEAFGRGVFTELLESYTIPYFGSITDGRYIQVSGIDSEANFSHPAITIGKNRTL